MKSIIAFSVFILVSLFAYGQSSEPQINDRYDKSNVGKHLKGLNQNDKKDWHSSVYQKNRDFSKNMELKSSLTIKQKLDSLIYQKWDSTNSQWVDDSKHIYTYDNNRNVTQYLCFFWEETSNQWIIEEKLEFTYDVNGNVIQYIVENGYHIGKEEYTYDAKGNETQMISYTGNDPWVLDWKRESTYDVNGNRTQILFYHWNAQWLVTAKREYTYDANGNETEYLWYDWDKTTNHWVRDRKRESAYDEDGNAIQSLFYNWDETTSQWLGDSKYKSNYDANGYEIQSISFSWDKTTSQWVSNSKREYTYDIDGNETQTIYYDWNETTSQWVDDLKEIQTYDANGNRTQWLRYDWEEITSRWVGDLKWESVYDINGNKTQESHYVWDETANQWVGDWKEVYTYDLSYDLCDLTLPSVPTEFYGNWSFEIYDNNANKPLVVSHYVWFEGEKDWVIENELAYYYSEHIVTSVNEIAESIKIYPNPTDGFITIETDQDVLLSIYNIHGLMVLQKKIQSTRVTIDISTCPKGIYLVKTNQQGKLKSGKIILK